MTETPLQSTDTKGASSFRLTLEKSQAKNTQKSSKKSAHKSRAVLAWALWDWGSAAFNAVVTTFVFTIYLVSDSFGGERFVSAQLGWALAIAGLLIAVLAPVVGQYSDRSGRQKLWLGIFTYAVVTLTALLFFVEPHPEFLILGLVLLATASVFFEFASVNYNAILTRVSTPKTMGRVSGFGWGMGYLGGIVLLLIVYNGFIQPDVGLFGVTSENGLSVRVAMLVSAVWFGVFALPVLLRVPSQRSMVTAKSAKIGFFTSYVVLFRTLKTLWKQSRSTVFFLIASAVFRDGLAGIFTFGGVLAAAVYGFSAKEVILFAIAANVVAGIATMLIGLLDDKIGAKPVIVASLIGLIVSGLVLFFLHDGGKQVFWAAGLALTFFVGPAQSASRTFLARMIPSGREGEIFGLYATTGRAVSFLAPTAFALCVTVFGATHYGILGLLFVLAVGLLLLLPVSSKPGTLSSRETDQDSALEQGSEPTTPAASSDVKTSG